jgi:hypothetical protein
MDFAATSAFRRLVWAARSWARVRAQEGRDGDGDEDRDDQHDHHQLDQREAALPLPLEPAPQSLQHVRFLLLEAV